MANIDDLLNLKLTAKKDKDYLKSQGCNEEDFTNKAAIIMQLINAAKSGDVRAAMFLIDKAKEEKPKKVAKTTLDKAREKALKTKDGK